jgi:molybdopterin-guanine dinucleotide biosynthesis protein A
LAGAGGDGAVAEDDDGLQPLVALYRRDALRAAIAVALASGDFAVRSLQAALRLPLVRFEGVRFGNLNTPDDLRVAGYRHD